MDKIRNRHWLAAWQLNNLQAQNSIPGCNINA
jgi:hypothetical protein